MENEEEEVRHIGSGEGPTMTHEQIKAYILSKMSKDEVIDRFLESGLLVYEKLKFAEGEELHPLMVMAYAAMDMGWDLIVHGDSTTYQVKGITTGTPEHIQKMADIIAIAKANDTEDDTTTGESVQGD